MFTPANHTLQSLCSWGTVTLLNGSLDEWVVRFPALLVGLLTAWPAFVLGRRIGGLASATLLTALILLMPIAVLEGAEARGYAFMLFFGTSASALLHAAITARRRELLLLYALVCALGIWGHLVTVVVPIGHAVVLVLLMLRSPSQRPVSSAINIH